VNTIRIQLSFSMFSFLTKLSSVYLDDINYKAEDTFMND
jgi:hypothetical protein